MFDKGYEDLDCFSSVKGNKEKKGGNRKKKRSRRRVQKKKDFQREGKGKDLQSGG